VDAIIAEERTLGFDGLTPFHRLADAVAELRRQIAELVAQQTAAGKRLAGYGASVGAVTLIQQFDLGSVLDFIADDKPLGEHLLGPGYRIPIVLPATIYDLRPASIFVLAWRYADTIIAKHQQYVDAGGEFVIPLPEISVRT